MRNTDALYLGAKLHFSAQNSFQHIELTLSYKFQMFSRPLDNNKKKNGLHFAVLQRCNTPVAYPGFFLRGGGGVSTNSVENRGQGERGSGAVAPVVRGSGGKCNLVQEISFHIVKLP